MKTTTDSYYEQTAPLRTSASSLYQEALLRCVSKLAAQIPVIGVRNPKIGRMGEHVWDYCDPYDWVIGFHAGQLWLAFQVSGDPRFALSASARQSVFRNLLRHPHKTDHDLGFQFSLSCVAEWKMTGNQTAYRLALEAASLLAQRFVPAGNYIQAWNLREGDEAFSRFASCRMIADTMENLGLLYWASEETGIARYREIADAHAHTAMACLIRPDHTTYHTYAFDPVSGQPLRGQTHQGLSDDSCWARGQAWMIHGFAQAFAYTQNPNYLQTAENLAVKAEALLGEATVPPWDYGISPDMPPYKDSSAAAIMASGLYLLSDHSQEGARARAFADRLLTGLLENADLTQNQEAQGLLSHGAAHVRAGKYDHMTPYGDYFFMEALMRSQGHTSFFW